MIFVLYLFFTFVNVASQNLKYTVYIHNLPHTVFLLDAALRDKNTFKSHSLQ